MNNSRANKIYRSRIVDNKVADKVTNTVKFATFETLNFDREAFDSVEPLHGWCNAGSKILTIFIMISHSAGYFAVHAG